MPRQGNGNYVPPAGQPVVTDTTIASSVENLLVADLAQALTTSIASDGQTVPTADLPMGSHNHTFVKDANKIDQYGSAGQVQRADLIKLVSVGYSGGVYSGTLALGQTTFVQNQMVLATFATSNGGPSALIVNGGSQFPILRGDGVSQLAAGDIIANAPLVLMWSNTFTAWIVVTGPGASGNVVLDTTYLRVDGGNVMTGPLHLSGLPISLPNEAASKSYVDSVVGPGAGGTVKSITTNDIQVLSAAAVDGLGNIVLSTHVNTANGLLKLNANGQVPLTLIDIASVTFKGVWPGGGANPAVPTGSTNVLNYYVINPAGNLTLYDWNGSAYVSTVVAAKAGDNIIYNFTASAGTPVGWYYLPRTVTTNASNVAITPTSPLFGAAATVQAWLTAADPAIAARLPLVGGTMTGPITLAANPAAPLQAATKQYVDAAIVTAAGVSSFNTRTGAVTLLSADVTGALGYTPANATTQNFSGPVSASTMTILAGGSLTTDKVNLRVTDQTAVTGVIAVDASIQSQMWNLTGAVTVSAINNLTNGNILRIMVGTNSFNITWPATVRWPLGVAPNLSAGPQLRAIIVMEKDRFGDFLASATMW